MSSLSRVNRTNRKDAHGRMGSQAGLHNSLEVLKLTTLPLLLLIFLIPRFAKCFGRGAQEAPWSPAEASQREKTKHVSEFGEKVKTTPPTFSQISWSPLTLGLKTDRQKVEALYSTSTRGGLIHSSTRIRLIYYIRSNTWMYKITNVFHIYI